MRNPDDLNPRQYELLRKLRTHPTGIPIEYWPRPATLRRWLRKPRFRAAMADMTATFRAQRDLLLASAASHAAMLLQNLLLGPDLQGLEPDQLNARVAKRMQSLSKVVRLDQLREKERRQLRRPRYRPPAEEAPLATARAIAAPRVQPALPAPVGSAMDQRDCGGADVRPA